MTTTATAARSGESQGYGAVRVWLFALCALVFAMILLGGTTRLTDSGLSITEWQPVIGIVPPLSEKGWDAAFALYKQTTEFQLVNRGMGLAEFKTIYWWEWSHRFLGRLIGAAFFVPFVVFWWRGMLGRSLLAKLLGIFVLGGLQGALGWYMVMSGLAGRTDVSQYRLAAHLTLAVLILGCLFWVALDIGRSASSTAPWSARARLSLALCALILLQIAIGGFVAGLDAGQAYNTWPLMNGKLIPEGLWVQQPWYLNLFENAVTVQFVHRVMAYVVAACVLAYVVAILRSETNAHARGSALILAAVLLAQLALGIATLLAQAPLWLSLAHQAGAMILFMSALYHAHALRGR